MPRTTGLGEKIANWIREDLMLLPPKSILARIWEAIRRWIEEHIIARFEIYNLLADAINHPDWRVRKQAWEKLMQKGFIDENTWREYAQFLANTPEGEANALEQAIFKALGIRNWEELWTELGERIYEAVLQASLIDPERLPLELRQKIGRFLGAVTLISSAPQIAGIISEIASLGQIESVGRAIQQVYWNLGLGFITWQTISPLVDAIIRQPLENWIAREFRPHKLTAAQLAELLTVRAISVDEFREKARDWGYDEAAIDFLIRIAYTPLPVSEIWRAFEDGRISENDVRRLLQLHGYTDSDITLMIQNHRPVEEESPRRTLRSTLINAFEAGIIGPEELAEKMRALGYSEEEISYTIQLAQLQQRTKTVTLQIGRIKEAYMVGRLNRQDAVYWLERLGLNPEAYNILLDTWDIEKRPPERLLSGSSIQKAYALDVLTRQEAYDWLIRLNYSPEAANLLLDIVDRQQAERERRGPGEPPEQEPVQRRRITVGAIIEALRTGLIDEQIARQKMLDLGYSEEDVELYIRLAYYTAPQAEKLPPRSSILDWYQKGIIDETLATTLLKLHGYSEETIYLFLQEAIFTASTRDILSMYLAGNIDYGEALRQLVFHQVPIEKAVDMLETVTDSVLAGNVLARLFEGLISEAEARAELQKLGLDSKIIERLVREVLD